MAAPAATQEEGKEVMDQIMLVTRTNDTRDDGLDHCLLGMSVDFAEFLLRLKEAYHAAEAHAGTSLYCLELFHGAAEWGHVDGYTSTGDWQQCQDETTIDEESTELQTIKVMDTGVVFSACLKNEDSNVYAETPELPWAKISQVAKWGGEGPPPKLYDGADIDMTINCPDEEDDDGDETD